MSEIFITAASRVTGADLAGARLGNRFGRMDLPSQLSLLAVEKLSVDFDAFARNRIGLCLAVRGGSLSTDVEYWRGRNDAGGPSPMLFAYTLPSAPIGEIAIRYRITGPDLCLWGGADQALAEARDWFRRGEIDGCICVACDAITPAAAEMIQGPPAAEACALFLQRESKEGPALRENDRDMKSLCDKILQQKSASANESWKFQPPN
jgi:3-oxoacyl-(acyl-carrier-protein) synthase